MAILLTLYSTSHCHLCEQAEAILQKMCLQNTVKYVVVEIADDATLVEQYALKIPVLKRSDTNNELSWPFTDIDIAQLIANR